MSVNRQAQSSSAFSRITVIAIILVGVFTFSAFVVLSAYAPVLRDNNDGGGHALSKSAIGYAFLAALLKESGVAVVTQRGVSEEANDGVIVYTPANIAAMNRIGALDRHQITLIIVPKWNAIPDPMKPGWVRHAGMVTLAPMELSIGDTDISLELERRKGAETLLVEPADATGGLVLRTVPSRNVGAIDNLQSLKPNQSLEPILVANNGDILIAKVAEQPLYIISDADLANTHGLSNINRANVTAIFLDYARAGGPVIFDLSLHGIERTRNIMRLALEPPFLAASLCALFASLLLALKAASRFGPIRTPARPFEAGKAALADNSAALIRMAQREEAFGVRYADLTRRQISKAIGAPKNMTTASLDSLIEKLAAGKTKLSFTTLVQQAASADGIGPFVRAAKRLYQFKKEIVREYR